MAGRPPSGPAVPPQERVCQEPDCPGLQDEAVPSAAGFCLPVATTQGAYPALLPSRPVRDQPHPGQRAGGRAGRAALPVEDAPLEQEEDKEQLNPPGEAASTCG